MSLSAKPFSIASVLISAALGPSAIAAEPVDPRVTDLAENIRAIEDRTNPEAARHTISERMAENGVPGVGVAIIDDGEIVWAGGFGKLGRDSDETVDAETVFSAGSVSKIINAAVILRLVQDGKLDLDADVNTYLTSWKVPEDRYTQNTKVTLRMLLAHTSGFSQHGFPDFQPGDDLPTALQKLEGQRPARHDPVRLMFEPGTAMDYSGGGITVTQVVVEDVTGLSYPEAAHQLVFEPLGMNRSSFVNPLPASHGNIAKAHDRRGRPTALPRGYEAMPEMAASGLWTSSGDMAKFMLALLRDESFLSDVLREDMLTRVPKSWHGLGPRLNGEGDKRVFHHGGANNSYQTWIEGHPAEDDAFIVLTNGASGRTLAYELRIAAEPIFGWKISFPDDYEEPSLD